MSNVADSKECPSKKTTYAKSQGVSHSECEAETYDLTKGER